MKQAAERRIDRLDVACSVGQVPGRSFRADQLAAELIHTTHKLDRSVWQNIENYAIHGGHFGVTCSLARNPNTFIDPLRPVRSRSRPRNPKERRQASLPDATYIKTPLSTRNPNTFIDPLRLSRRDGL